MSWKIFEIEKVRKTQSHMQSTCVRDRTLVRVTQTRSFKSQPVCSSWQIQPLLAVCVCSFCSLELIKANKQAESCSLNQGKAPSPRHWPWDVTAFAGPGVIHDSQSLTLLSLETSTLLRNLGLHGYRKTLQVIDQVVSSGAAISLGEPVFPFLSTTNTDWVSAECQALNEGWESAVNKQIEPPPHRSLWSPSKREISQTMSR